MKTIFPERYRKAFSVWKGIEGKRGKGEARKGIEGKGGRARRALDVWAKVRRTAIVSPTPLSENALR